ncbi:MAG TPA: hypothetical protein PKE55_01605 [Kiritimatiellia bacterium]|nr:hypothetical protein [Kiritimatiellia bacterium]
MIRKFVPGEDYSRSTVAGRTLLHDHPALAEDERTDRNNPGITLVVL